MTCHTTGEGEPGEHPSVRAAGAALGRASRLRASHLWGWRSPLLPPFGRAGCGRCLMTPPRPGTFSPGRWLVSLGAGLLAPTSPVGHTWSTTATVCGCGVTSCRVDFWRLDASYGQSRWYWKLSAPSCRSGRFCSVPVCSLLVHLEMSLIVFSPSVRTCTTQST